MSHCERREGEVKFFKKKLSTRQRVYLVGNFFNIMSKFYCSVKTVFGCSKKWREREREKNLLFNMIKWTRREKEDGE